MKTESNDGRIPIKQFWKILRPTLRPSLAAEEYLKYLISRERQSLLDDGNYVISIKPRTLEWMKLITQMPDCHRDEIDDFWKKRGFSYEWAEGMATERAKWHFEYLQTNGVKLDTASSIKAKYDKWRKEETVRQRQRSASLKAQKEAAAKAEAGKIAPTEDAERKADRSRRRARYARYGRTTRKKTVKLKGDSPELES
jgi:hypothetical protein